MKVWIVMEATGDGYHLTGREVVGVRPSEKAAEKFKKEKEKESPNSHFTVEDHPVLCGHEDCDDDV